MQGLFKAELAGDGWRTRVLLLRKFDTFDHCCLGGFLLLLTNFIYTNKANITMGRGGGKGGGGGKGNSRIRDVDSGDRDSKKSTASLKGLSWNANAAQPAFLRNALTALAGPKEPEASTSSSGRPSIPERPGGPHEEEEDEEPQSEEDEWDMGRGEEAPTVVVLKEGRHLDRDEVDKLRAHAKAGSAPDPLASSSAPTAKTKHLGSLAFSTGAPNKRKISEADGSGSGGVTESWDEVIKRSKLATEKKAKEKKQEEEEAKKAKEKTEKKKKKEKKDREKKVSMLSFDD